MAARIPTLPATSPAELVLPATATEADWLAARTAGIGGSEIAALVGASKWGTPFEVFRAKADGWVQPEFNGNVYTEWGHRLEDAVARKAADELGLVARTGGGLWRHRDHPVALVTPDRIATRRRSWIAVGLIECKTASDDEGWRDGSAPLQYLAQTQWQMGILGLQRGWVACLELTPARNFHLCEVTFEAAWFAEMVEVAEKFWLEHVLAGEPPMLDFAHPRTTELLAQLHPAPVVESVQLDDDARAWIADFHAAKEAAEAAAARLEEAKNWVKFQVGEAAAGYLGDQKVVSYPEIRTTRIETKKLRENFPEAAQACEVTSTHRRLTVNKLPSQKVAGQLDQLDPLDS